MSEVNQPAAIGGFAMDCSEVPGYVVLLNSQGRILYINSSFAGRLGYSPSRLENLSIDAILPEETGDWFANLLDKPDAPGTKVHFEGEFLSHSKVPVPVMGEMSLLESGEAFAMGVFFEAEYSYAQRENHRVLIENSQDIIFKLSREGVFEFVSSAWEKLLGYPAESVVGKSFEGYVHPEDRGLCFDFLKKIFETGEALEAIEYRVKNSRGEWRWHASNASPIKDSLGRVLYFMGTARDVTEAREAKEKARAFHELMRYVIEYSRGAVAVHDRDLNYLYVSRTYLESYRVREEDVIGRHHYEVFPDLPQKWRKIHQKALQGIVSSAEEDPFVREDGSVDWTRWECRPWYETSGRIGGIIIYTEVINQQKEIERMVYTERERFKTTLFSVGDGVISTDSSGNIAMMNHIAEKLTGWSLKEAEGEPLEKIFKIRDREEKEELSGNMIKEVMGEGKTLEFDEYAILVSRDGTEVPVEDSAAPIKDGLGKINGVVVVFRDYTDKLKRIKKIEYLSLHDHLTGLYNRRYMEDTIKRLDQPRHLPFTIMILDVNGLKLTNDAFGHEMGDALLKAVATMLKEELRGGEILCRAGGDEFNILLPNTREDEAEKIKKRILEATKAIKLDSVIVSLAMGYATKESVDQDIEFIFTLADNRMYKDKLRYGKLMRSRTIEMVLRNIHLKYDSEQVHTERVSEYCEAIARAMGFPEPEIHKIKTAGVLHDIGKIMVPPEILKKSGPLTAEEYEIIKRHPETSYQILKSVDDYAAFAEDVLYHHERIDGKSYPEGLRGEEIPLNARIIAVADAYEAMTADRSYQRKKSREEAIGELRRCSGTQFDPRIVETFIENVLT
ncbi:MAG: hypothetical protein AVO33_04485 [delta proteobacterium ML8_F1]|nr:MAG: hypothetical protein AVO33_04485 [delta proteobacterium ML8_F1]